MGMGQKFAAFKSGHLCHVVFHPPNPLMMSNILLDPCLCRNIFI